MEEEKVRWAGIKFWHPWSKHYGIFIWLGWWKVSVELSHRTDITRFE